MCNVDRLYSERSACITSTRDARSAGINEARIAAPAKTAAAPISGRRFGTLTSGMKRPTSFTSAKPPTIPARFR